MLFLLTIDLLLHIKFKNGKFSFCILLDTMSLPSACALAEKVQLSLVFSQGKHFTKICLALCCEWLVHTLRKAWLHYGELEGSEEPAIVLHATSSFLHWVDFM